MTFWTSRLDYAVACLSPLRDNKVMVYKIHTTPVFERWLKKIRDKTAKSHVIKRLRMLSYGHFGDCKTVYGGVSELRIDVGKGYRIYYTLKGNKLIVVLAGGVKDSQERDIKQARQIAKQLGQDEE